jgi:hypothetical protein
MTKEDRNTLVNALYNRCANGEISVNQREQLILKINSMYTATESINDTNVEDTIQESTENTQELVQETRNLTPTQKYKMFKESVYQKCSNGEITVEMREELLAKAREAFSASI